MWMAPSLSGAVTLICCAAPRTLPNGSTASSTRRLTPGRSTMPMYSQAPIRRLACSVFLPTRRSSTPWPLTLRRSARPASPLTRTLSEVEGKVSPSRRSMKPRALLSMRGSRASRSMGLGTACGGATAAVGCAIPRDTRMPKKRLPTGDAPSAEPPPVAAPSVLPWLPDAPPMKLLGDADAAGIAISGAELACVVLVPVLPPARTSPLAGSARRSPTGTIRPSGSRRMRTWASASVSGTAAMASRRAMTSLITAGASQLVTTKLALWNSPFLRSTKRLSGRPALRLSSASSRAPAGSVVASSRSTWVTGLRPYRLHLPSTSVMTCVPSSMYRRTPGTPISSTPCWRPSRRQSM
ncbi:hypothetical protein D9M72_460920 [compost metagenome]